MKNINDLRNVLIKSIDEVRNGEITPETAKILCSQTQTILNLTKLEMQYCSRSVSIEFMEYSADGVVDNSEIREIPPQNIDKHKHKELMRDERYKHNCNDCVYIQSIHSVVPPRVNCSFGGILQRVLVDFDTCPKINP